MRRYKVAQEGEAQPTVELTEIQSEIARNRTHLGDRLRQRGRLRAASAEYRRALRAGPDSTIILNRLGETLIHTRGYDEALPHLEKARYLDPDRVHTYYLLGRLHHEAGDYTRAPRRPAGSAPDQSVPPRRVPGPRRGSTRPPATTKVCAGLDRS